MYTHILCTKHKFYFNTTSKRCLGRQLIVLVVHNNQDDKCSIYDFLTPQMNLVCY